MHARRRRALSAAAVTAAIFAARGRDALAHGDTTLPVLNAATLSPTPVTGHNGWYRTSPVALNMTATDDTAVARFEYAFSATGPWIPVPVATPAASASASADISEQQLVNYGVRYRAVDT